MLHELLHILDANWTNKPELVKQETLVSYIQKIKDSGPTYPSTLVANYIVAILQIGYSQKGKEYNQECLTKIDEATEFIENLKLDTTYINQLFSTPPCDIFLFFQLGSAKNFKAYEPDFDILLSPNGKEEIRFFFDYKASSDTETDIFIGKNMPINGDVDYCCYDSYLPIYKLMQAHVPNISIRLSSRPSKKYIYVITFRYFRQYAETIADKGLSFIPEFIWEDIRNNKAILILNDTAEYSIYKDFFPIYKKIVNNYASKNVFILSGTKPSEINSINFSTKESIFQKIKNVFIKNKQQPIHFLNFRFFEEAIAESKRTFFADYTIGYRTQQIESNARSKSLKHFLCLNRIVKDYRVVTSFLFFKNNLLAKSILSQDRYDNVTDFKFGHNTHNELLHILEDESVESFKASLPWYADTSDFTPNLWNSIPLDLLNKAFLWVVTETEFAAHPSNTTFFSEKTYKPMAFFMPFIIIGNPYTLKTLRSEGYKTFSKWWDESYDNESDPVKRMQMIFETINKISLLSIEELSVMYEDMKDTIIHNNTTLLNRHDGKEAMQAIVNRYHTLND